MELSHELSAIPGVAGSVSVVEHDGDRALFRATYDSDRDTASLAVVAVVATVLDRDPLTMAPLQSVIETDALDELTTKSPVGIGRCTRISFCYEGVEVTVFSEGVIEVDRVENA